MRNDIFDTYLRTILDKSPKNPAEEENAAKVPEDQLKKTAGQESGLGGMDKTGGSSREESVEQGRTIRLNSETMLNELSKRPVQTEPAKNIKKRKKVRKANYSAYGGIVLATLVLCCSILISLFVIVMGRDFLGIDTNNNEFTLYIEENWSISKIADYLYENGIIEYPKLFTQYAKLRVGDGSVYPGDLDVMPSMSYADLIDSLTKVRDAHPTVTVTFIEGSTIDDCAKILEENGVCGAEEFIFAFNSSDCGYDFETHISSSGLKYYKCEGYLFPDTYEFYVGDSAANIVKKIKERTAEIMNQEFIAACQESGHSLEEIVTMASILQLESGSAEEMPKIASVFYNRLSHPDIYPRLQSNTTEKYIDNVIKAGSSLEFQEMFDAYDTYVCQGLPIGPICNPGAEALNAALYPGESDYFYFCSDDEGKFYYAETYAEHEQNVAAAGLEV